MTDTIADSIRRTKDTYDRIGQEFDEETETFSLQVAYPKLMHVLEEDRGLRGKRILDVGCGSGRLVRLLEEAGAAVTGIDLSPRSAARGRGLPLACGSMLSLPCLAETFDIVVSYHSFNYVPFERQGQALLEQYRVLRKDGTLLLATFPAESRTRKPVVLERHGESFILYPRTKDELRDLLDEAGFFYLRDEAPVCTSEELAHASDSLRPLIEREPYAQLILATKL